MGETEDVLEGIISVEDMERVVSEAEKALEKQRDEMRLFWQKAVKENACFAPYEDCGTMPDACVNNDDLEDATKIFAERRKEIPGSSRGTAVFGTLVKGFAQRKERHRTMELYEEMREDSVTCNPVTYNTLLDSCARLGDMSKGTRLFRDMCERGVDPDVLTYSRTCSLTPCRGTWSGRSSSSP